MYFTAQFTKDEQDNYWTAAARIRGISKTQLMNEVISKILDDQLILAILDDGDRKRKPLSWHMKRHLKFNLYDGLKKKCLQDV